MTEASEIKYTVAMCNLNNGGVIDESITSIADQLDDRFEIVVVDDGSTDDSLSILRDLQATYPNLRIVHGDNDNIAEARNQSVRKARGEYVLMQMDPDDRYEPGIADFVEVFEQLNEQIDGDFYLKGDSINIAPRQLLLEYPYRSLDYGEDKDFWRRLLADNKIIWLEHNSFCNVLREEYGTVDIMSIYMSMTIVEFRSGVTFPSFVRYTLARVPEDTKLFIYRLLISPLCYLIALRRGRYPPPAPEYRRMGAVETAIDEHSMTLAEIESEYGVQIDRDALSLHGEQIFYGV